MSLLQSEPSKSVLLKTKKFSSNPDQTQLPVIF